MMKKTRIILLLFLVMAASVHAVRAEEHVVKRGETALQIALDHGLTMDQLSQLNPGVDLEMMLVGDKLIVPEEGTSFADFLSRRYEELIRIRDPYCEVLADQSALCFFHAENLSDLPLFGVQLKTTVRSLNGSRGEAVSGIALMQILPGESLPVYTSVPGSFSEITDVSVSAVDLSYSELMTGSFRIPSESYHQSLTILPDGAAASAAIEFTDEAIRAYSDRQINILAAAYDSEGKLCGIRSLYSSFYPRLDITVYSAYRGIKTVELIPEAY